MRTLSGIQRRLTGIDLYGYRRCSLLRSRRRPAQLARWLSASGDGVWYAVLAVSICLLEPSQINYFITLAFGFLLERPTYWLLKNSFRRNRPVTSSTCTAALLIAHDKFSFPSGHTCAAFLFAAISSHYLPSVLSLFFLWATAVGVSRVVVGVHYPSDVVAGAVLGLVIGEWVLVTATLFGA